MYVRGLSRLRPLRRQKHQTGECRGRGNKEGNPRLWLQILRERPQHLPSTSSAAAPRHSPTSCGVREGGRRDVGGQQGRTLARLARSPRLRNHLQAGIISSGKQHEIKAVRKGKPHPVLTGDLCFMPGLFLLGNDRTS